MTEHPHQIPVATMPCAACHRDVSAGRFCAFCGARLSLSPGRPGWGRGPRPLRIRNYAAAPTENVLQPSVVSSMFPHLPNQSRSAFRIALSLVFVVLVAFSALHWYVPMMATAIFAPPLLVVAYLTETGLFRDLSPWVWARTALLGIGVGVGWAVLTNATVAESYSLGLGTEVPTTQLVLDAVTIPFGALVALQLPAVLVRLTRPPVKESLHGFAIGLLGASMFTLATNVTRMIPEFGQNEVVGDQRLTELLLQAVVRGIAEPLTGMALGGLAGAGMWYAARPGPDRRGLLAVGALGMVVSAIAYGSVGLAEAYRVSAYIQFLVHILFAAVAITALRIGLQVMMLHEQHAASFPELPILCTWCQHVVPDTKFCPACGVASHASSLTSRNARRADRPQPRTELVDQ